MLPFPNSLDLAKAVNDVPPWVIRSVLRYQGDRVSFFF